jgi:hypothetical protein
MINKRQAVEQFFTDDGVPYWYDRRTGETFWERPLADEERLTVKKGGTVLVCYLFISVAYVLLYTACMASTAACHQKLRVQYYSAMHGCKQQFATSAMLLSPMFR